MAGGGLQMAGRNRSFITYLRLRALFVPLLTDCGGTAQLWLQSFDWLVRNSPWQQCQGASSEVSTCTSIARR